MANKIQVKRGNRENIPNLNVGEFGLCIDTKELFIGLNDENMKIANFKDLNNLKIEFNNYTMVNLRNFGAIGDGNSHKLSTIFSSLELAKILYPSANSLDDEIDLVALEKAIEYCKQNKKDLYIPSGTFILNRELWVKGGFDVYFNGNALIEVTSNYTGGIMFDGTKNSKWYNAKVVRKGISPKGLCNTIEIRNDSDYTLQFFNCYFKNSCSSEKDLNSVNRGVQVHYKASPIFETCIFIGGGDSSKLISEYYSSGICIGGIGSSSASPILNNCIGYGGIGKYSSGIELDNTVNGGHVQLNNCIGYGGEGEFSCGIVIDDVTLATLNNCNGFGGKGNYCHGFDIWAFTNSILNGCNGYGGRGDFCCGLNSANGNSIFTSCTFLCGAYGYHCMGASIGGTSFHTFNNTFFGTPSFSVRKDYSISNILVLNTEYPLSQLRNIGIQVKKSGLSGNVKIGYTIGGNEIIDETPINQIVAESWLPVKIKDTAYKIVAKNTPIYITTSEPLNDNDLVIVANMYIGQDYEIGLDVESDILLNSCTIKTSPFTNNKSLYIGSKLNMTKGMIVNSLVISDIKENLERGTALTSDTYKNNVPIYNTLVKGNQWNVITECNQSEIRLIPTTNQYVSYNSIFIDKADGLLKFKNSSGVDKTL